MIALPHQHMSCFLGVTQLVGALRNKKQWLNPTLKWNIGLLLPPQLKSIGCRTYFMNFKPNLPLLQQFTATMWVLHMCVPILYFILAWNTLPLISTLFVIKCPRSCYVFLIFILLTNSLTLSQSPYLAFSF